MLNNSNRDALVLTNCLDFPEVCSLCRYPVNSDSMFCEKCGAKLYRQIELPNFENKHSRLEDWFIKDNHLFGCIFNDDRFPDGHFILTTEIKQKFYNESGVLERVVTRSGTNYILGKKLLTNL